ncbi:MAG: VCBS repeat-containing protein [Flavobacteriales bacterium]|nr:VCBS repeat-containing protein [Flavobacteriales bacterium]
MLKHFTLGTAALMLSSALQAQLGFTNSTSLMSPSVSGGCMGVVDMNGDGRDDIAKLDNARTLVVDYQNADGSFTTVNYGNMSGSGQWGWAIADVDNNGHKDAVSGGSYDGTHYMRIASVGNGTLTDLNGPDIFTQGMSIGDMNNDGRVDVYACHDDGPPSIWFTNASGVPVNNNAYINWTTSCTGTSGDMSGNYGSNFVDFDNDGDQDFYIAHCRQGVNSSTDCRRWNRLFVNDGTNHFSDLAASYGLEIRNQTWTTDFGDIDNDGDFDAVMTNHDATMQLFENDGTGHFTEITAGSGLEYNSFFLQSKFADFDNDGWIDLIIAGGDEFFFKNNGDQTFTQVTNLFPSNKDMHSFALGDLNKDGFQDVFANYGSNYITPDNNNPDRLWLNNGNANHWFGVNLVGTTSNKDAVGARITITGPWGTQIREVRAGESYGVVCSFTAHFGLGGETVIPTLTINWPSGLEETFNNMPADAYITVIEGTCVSPTATITTPGNPIICGNGDSIDLTANAGFNYTWSTGATSQTITVTAPGNYTVTIDDGSGCSANTSIFVQQSPDETPTVNASGDLSFCEGGVVTLTSSAASSYAWTGGATTQSIDVSAAGTYSVSIEGTCGTFTSADVVVDVLDAPDAPSASDVTIPVPGTADLNATGDNINWYDAATGGSLVGSGNAWTTPFLFDNATFWATAGMVHGGGAWYGGPVDRLNTAAPGQYHTNADNYPFFTAYEPFTIVSVKVYASGAGNRTIALINRTSGNTLATAAYNIPDGESRVDLNYQVPAAGDYGLRVVGGNPQLWRDGNGSNPAYPYALGTVGSITSSSVSGANATAYYYFFYDWEVEAEGTLCESSRTPVDVTVLSVGMPEVSANGTSVFPNPASDRLTVDFGAVRGNTTVAIMDVTGRVAKSVSNVQQSTMLQIGVSELAAGEYVVRVNHDGGTSMHRVVIK